MNTEETSNLHRSICLGDDAGYETAFYPWPEYAGDWAALLDYRKGDRMTAIVAPRGEGVG